MYAHVDAVFDGVSEFFRVFGVAQPLEFLFRVVDCQGLVNTWEEIVLLG